MKTMDLLRMAMICAIGIFAATSCSDDDDNTTTQQTVPTAVQTAFDQDYTDAGYVEWDVENGYLVAEFTQDGKDHEAWYTGTGTWVMTEIDHGTNISSLPQAVQQGYAATTYAQQGWVIDDIDEIRRPDYDTIYKIEVEKSGQPDHDLYFDAGGTLYKDVEDQDSDSNSSNTVLINNTLPTEISTFISTNYAGAQIVDYEKEAGGYEVDIRHNGESKELLFSSSYAWVQTSTDCSRSIPDNIRSAVSASYPGKVIDDCEYVETAAGESYYLVDLDDYSRDLKVTTDGVITEVAG